MRYFLILFLIAFASLQYKLWFGEGSVREWTQIKAKIEQQSLENQQLDAKNQSLIADVQELKSADQALEEDARQSLGMIKNDETYFQIIETPQPTKEKSHAAATN
jgi:cell division protein FtsB